MTDLNELKRLALAATPGPWNHYRAPLRKDRSANVIVNEVQVTTGAEPVVRWPGFDGMDKKPAKVAADAAFIAAANPAAILDLIAQLEQANRKLALRSLIEEGQELDGDATPPAGEMPDNWRCVEKKNCYVLHCGNEVVATLAGPVPFKKASLTDTSTPLVYSNNCGDAVKSASAQCPQDDKPACAACLDIGACHANGELLDVSPAVAQPVAYANPDALDRLKKRELSCCAVHAEPFVSEYPGKSLHSVPLYTTPYAFPVQYRYADERYCMFCEKPGHRTAECHSTHGLNTPRDRELSALARAAAFGISPAEEGNKA
ncbi:hypothetical protein ACIPEN_14415 [Herbaspirillum chlorophenolicum]|uniref:CCHC-type domain-containing protein n=1 Tax=Herbaspirillum chlorophenolicum TaxID=211589 RepID=A0ABW8F151_9BURK